MRITAPVLINYLRTIIIYFRLTVFKPCRYNAETVFYVFCCDGADIRVFMCRFHTEIFCSLRILIFIKLFNETILEVEEKIENEAEEMTETMSERMTETMTETD